MHGEDLSIALSLLECVVGDRKLEDDHPYVALSNYKNRYEKLARGEGTQISSLRRRYRKLTWGMDNYVRSEEIMADFTTKFTNYPFLGISGIGGVSKTELL